MHRSLLLAVLSLSVLLSPLIAAQYASYTFTPIDVPGSLGTSASGINNQGQIVGTYIGTQGPSHGSLLSEGTLYPDYSFLPREL
jgi:opacity protein-like surface antigen